MNLLVCPLDTRLCHCVNTNISTPKQQTARTTAFIGVVTLAEAQASELSENSTGVALFKQARWELLMVRRVEDIPSVNMKIC